MKKHFNKTARQGHSHSVVLGLGIYIARVKGIMVRLIFCLSARRDLCAYGSICLPEHGLHSKLKKCLLNMSTKAKKR
jgi:hypothetical protein